MAVRESCLPGVTWLNRRRVAAILVLVGGLIGSPVSTSSPVAVDVQREDGAFVIAASATLRTDAATAWRILTAYGEYARFIPGVRSSHVVARRGRVVTVEQSDEALLWPMHWPLHIIYEITESPPDRIESRAVSNLIPALSSYYVLTPTAAGVRLDYSGHVATGLTPFGDVEQWAIRRTVNRQFQALVDEIERYGSDAPPPGPN